MKNLFFGMLGCRTRTLSIAQVADIFQVSTDQVQVWVHDDTLPARCIWGMTRIDDEVVGMAIPHLVWIVEQSRERRMLSSQPQG